MKGHYRIIIANAKVRYDFTIRRNITIIKGNSATGKTTLVEMIREYYEAGSGSGITLKADRPCRVLAGRDWKILLSAIHQTIIFIDEENAFLPTNEFAESVRQSDNYYVIISREGLPNLPYSTEEIYGIRESGKYGSLKQVYNEFYHIYGKPNAARTIKAENIIVADSNSGFEFFKELPQKGNYPVISAGGKSNIFRMLMNMDPRNTLVIADGAAFGPEMDRIMKLIQQRPEITLYLPESFEWLILESGILSDKNLDAIMETPERFIESSQFFSWERFFSNLLITLTKDTFLKYSKHRLNKAYLQKDISAKIINQITGIEF